LLLSPRERREDVVKKQAGKFLAWIPVTTTADEDDRKKLISVLRGTAMSTKMWTLLFLRLPSHDCPDFCGHLEVFV
jgi:hypothetical protein